MKHHLLLMLFLACVSSLSAQQLQVSGKVTNSEDGSGFPGVNVIIKGSNKGTVTDIDGNYTLGVESSDVLLFSFVGYKRTEIAVGGRTTINIELIDDISQLNEVVVVGYGVQTKREVTGSIAKVNGEDLQSIAVPSFEAALQGKAAGVQVIQGSGMAGSGSVIRVRGISSISASGDPLYVLDGVPITQDQFLNGNRGALNTNPLATLNPNDIESIEILKDASAAGIYGSRGANGVVLITTRRGKAGKPVFNFSTKQGFSNMAVEPDRLNAAEYIQLRQEAYENDGGTGRVTLPENLSWEEALANDTDWVDETTRTGYVQSYNLSASASLNKLRVYFGASFTDDQSFLVGNKYQRISGRLNLDYEFSSKFNVSLSTSASQGINDRVDYFSGSLGGALSNANPIFPIYDTDDTNDNIFYNATSADPGWSNPVRIRELLDWRNRENRSITTLKLNFKPIESLSVNAIGGLDYMDMLDDQFRKPELLNFDNQGEATQYPTWVTNYNIGLNATYEFDLNSNTNFSILLGTEYQSSLTERWSQIKAYDVTAPLNEDPDIPVRDNGLSNPEYGDDNPQEWSFVSYFTRLNFKHANKYIAQLSGRVDGSSRFGSNNRYGFFPTAALAWVVSEEDFLNSSDVLSFLKLKTSWGIAGNSNIPNYERFGTFQEGDGSTLYNGEPTIYPVRLENPDLKWETTRTLDLGIELGFLNDRVVADVSYYNKRTEDVLVNLAVQPSTGFGNFWDNAGVIENKGFDISVTSRNLVGEFSWTSNVNIGYNSNEVISLGGYSEDAVGGGTNDTRIRPGNPVGSNFLVRFARVDPENGKPIWLDKEGNETYEFNLDNRVVTGSVVPDLTGGVGNQFSFKNFDLNVLFTFTVGGNIYDGSAKRQVPSLVTEWNFRGDIANRWRQPGDVADFPKLTMEPIDGPDGASPWQYNSDLFLYDASYLRLRNITLGYNLNDKVSGKMGLNNVRFTISATNLFTWTEYPGDPEIARDFENAQDRNLSPNVTFLTAPQQRTFTIGINASF